MTTFPPIPPVPTTPDQPMQQFMLRLKQTIDLLVKSVNGTQPVTLATYYVPHLPTPTPGLLIWVQNGCKPGQTHGNGTGVPAYADGRQWFILGTDTLVTS